ncbi:C39 family peptidase [Patescibacteria group bacterium]|nr:C39 family peptidase [Patescibacteria group bacterium]
MFKFFLKFLIFIYCFVFLFYFSVQIINDFDNYILNENNNYVSSGQPWLTNKINRPDIKENNKKINNDTNIVRPDIEDKIFIKNVPFTTQSPFANWENSMEQDGCEEASSIMVIKWIRNESLEKEEALNYILDISEYTKEKYGEYRDVSVYNIKDWIFNDYFNYENVEVLENITKEIIIDALNNNKILLVPTNGRLLGNPNFVSPGPKTHMVVVLGYDILKNIFIVNDPGTRLGENYEYDMDILYNAIYSYPTGYHEDVDFVEKNIIAVWK